MSLTLTEDSIVESLDDTIISRGGGIVDPQVTPASGDRGVGFPSPGHVLSDPPANSTVIMGTGGPRPITPPNPDIEFDISTILTTSGHGLIDPSGSRTDVGTLGTDVTPVADKFGNLSITGGSQQGGELHPQMPLKLKLRESMELKAIMMMREES